LLYGGCPLVPAAARESAADNRKRLGGHKKTCGKSPEAAGRPPKKEAGIRPVGLLAASGTVLAYGTGHNVKKESDNAPL